jgi:signal peptide peptidase SppA
MKPAHAQRIVADLLCNPVSMRSAEHFATVLALSMPAPTAGMMHDAADDDEGMMPWEKPLYSVADGIAHVPVRGPIVKGYDAMTCWYYGLMSTDALAVALDELAEREDVAAVVFDFNSPGGSSAGMPEVAEQIAALGQIKATIAYVGDQACSNGYRLAAACDIILTTRSATLGCIGTYIALYDRTEQLKAAGIKLELFAAGAYKGMGLDGNPLTDPQRAYLQATTDRSNDMFVDFVLERRGAIAPETMQGQWFDGEQAVELGLADQIVTGLPAVLAALRPHIPASVAPRPSAPLASPAAAAAPALAAAPAPAAAAPTFHITLPAMSFAAPQVTVAPAAVNVTVDSRLEKDSIQVSQSQSGGAKKILTDATGAITGIEPT